MIEATPAASSVVRGFLVTGMFSTFLLGVLYLQHVHGYGALRTGLAFLPLTLVLGLLSLGVTARLMERFGPSRVLVAGLVFITAALILLSRLPAQTDYLYFVAASANPSGKSRFSATLEQHAHDVAEYRKALHKAASR